MNKIDFYAARRKWEVATISPYLEHYQYNLTAVAECLLMNRSTLVQMLQRWVLEETVFPGRDVIVTRYRRRTMAGEKVNPSMETALREGLR